MNVFNRYNLYQFGITQPATSHIHAKNTYAVHPRKSRKPCLRAATDKVYSLYNKHVRIFKHMYKYLTYNIHKRFEEETTQHSVYAIHNMYELYREIGCESPPHCKAVIKLEYVSYLFMPQSAIHVLSHYDMQYFIYQITYAVKRCTWEWGFNVMVSYSLYKSKFQRYLEPALLQQYLINRIKYVNTCCYMDYLYIITLMFNKYIYFYGYASLPNFYIPAELVYDSSNDNLLTRIVVKPFLYINIPIRRKVTEISAVALYNLLYKHTAYLS